MTTYKIVGDRAVRVRPPRRVIGATRLESESMVLSFAAGVAISAALAVGIGWFLARSVLCGGSP